MNKIQRDLIEASMKAAHRSYSPYSKFRVGAAVLSDNNIYIGANIENSSSNLGICAERIAISMAIMNGAIVIEGIAVSCIDAKKDSVGRLDANQCMPCGACRQWIQELCPKAWIVTNGSDKVFSISDLLPTPFIL